MLLVNKLIHIAIASDARYVAGAVGTLASIRLSLELDIALHIIFLQDNIDLETQEKIRTSLLRLKGETYIEFKEILADFSGFPEFYTPSKMPYARLCLPNLCNFSRIIYIDSDFLICKSLLPLFISSMKGVGVMAAQDWLLKKICDELPPNPPFQINPHHPYINSGILVLDLDYIRSEKLFEKALLFLSKFPQFCPSHDQSAINYTFNGRIDLMDESYNIQNTRSNIGPIDILKILIEKSGNIHFISQKCKPWSTFSNYPAETVFRILLDEVFPYWKSEEFKKDFLRWRIRQFFVHWYPMLFRMRGRFKKLLGKKWEPDFGAAQNWELYLSDRRDLKAHKAELDELYASWRRQIRGAMR
jgi:lipopolysaccharide biosynthesis glycosyltransferase